MVHHCCKWEEAHDNLEESKGDGDDVDGNALHCQPKFSWGKVWDSGELTYRPKLKGDFGSGLPLRRLHSTQLMEIAYDMALALARRPTTLRNAVVLRRLSSEIAMVMVSEARMALIGIGMPIVETRRNHELNGRPSSRANAHACREPAATMLRFAQIFKAETIETMAMVPAVLPVLA